MALARSSPSKRRTPQAGLDSPAEEGADRAVGALLGLAVGDAIGTTLEFAPRDTRPHQTEMLGGGPFGLRPGQWTDDTAMALALADSLLTCSGLDPADLMRRFVEWWRKGAYSCTGTCFDIGATTREALARFERTGDPFSGSPDEDKAGNGSLMRLAPVVLAAHGDRERAIAWARSQSRTTHGAPHADTVGAVTGQLAGAIYGASAIPQRWLLALSWRTQIESTARALWPG